MFAAQKQGVVHVITGDEPLTVETVDAAGTVLEQCIRVGQPKVVFDLSGVPLVDSAGLELLTAKRRQCIRSGGILQLTGVNALVCEILQMTGLDAQFEIQDTVVAAVGGIAR